MLIRSPPGGRTTAACPIESALVFLRTFGCWPSWRGAFRLLTSRIGQSQLQREGRDSDLEQPPTMKDKASQVHGPPSQPRPGCIPGREPEGRCQPAPASRSATCAAPYYCMHAQPALDGAEDGAPRRATRPVKGKARGRAVGEAVGVARASCCTFTASIVCSGGERGDAGSLPGCQLTRCSAVCVRTEITAATTVK